MSNQSLYRSRAGGGAETAPVLLGGSGFGIQLAALAASLGMTLAMFSFSVS